MSERLGKDFDEIWWTSRSLSSQPGADQRYFTGGCSQAYGLIDAAIFQLAELAPQAVAPRAQFIDPELWEHVRALVDQGRWDQVASQTAIFVEDRLRTWAELTSSSFGPDLATKVFHSDSGKFPLGADKAEQEGWHALGRGFMGALRNADLHRIQRRDDFERYAFGVLGTGSLLLTQLRNQYAEHTTP